MNCSLQAPLSMGFSRQEYWSGRPFPSPGDIPDPGTEPDSPALQIDVLPSEPPGKQERLIWALHLYMHVCVCVCVHACAEGNSVIFICNFHPVLSMDTEKCMILTFNCIHQQYFQSAQLCPTLCSPMNRSMPGLPVHHQLPEITQTHVHQVGDAMQCSHPLPSASPPAPNPSQHQGLFQQVNSSHEVAKVLEFQLQHQSFQ